MGTSGSAPNATQEDTRSLFSQLEEPCTPLTTTEVAEHLECPKRTAQQNLEALTELGELQTREIDDTSQVWWSVDRTQSAEPQSGLQEFGAFVSAVKDYAIFMLDSDGIVSSWNEGAERIKGYSENEIVGEHFSTFYTDEDIADELPDQNLETAADQGHHEDEGWRVRKDGTQFWANVTITAIRDDDGTLQGFTKVTRDMTEQRAYEQQLRQERDITEQILETVPVSICLITADGEFVRANRRALERMGCEESDLVDYSIDSWDLYDAEDTPIPADDWPWTQVTKTGEPVYDYQCQIDLPDIGRRWFSINAAPIQDGQSEDDRIVFSADDITEQKEYERQLRREYNQTEKLLRTAPIAIAVQDADGETVMANQRAQEALGLSEQEFIGEPEDADEWAIYDTNGDPLDPSKTPAARVLATGEPVRNEELAIDPPNGEQMRFHLNAVPLFDSDGAIERVITAGEDITELKKRERQLEQRKTELETELSDILGRISDAFYALDKEWQFTHLNDHAAEIMQNSRDELLGQEVWEAFPDATESVYWEELQTAMRTQEPVSFEVYEEEFDAWLEFNAHPSESGLSIYFRDVTERKERERTLSKYETIVETVNDGIYVKDDDGQFTMVNDAYVELTGYDREALVGAHASLVVDEETIEQAKETEEATTGGDTANPAMEAMIQTADGDSVPTEGTFATIEVDDGENEQVGVVRDISERKEYQRKVEESERRYRTLAENFPNGAVGLFDEDLRYTVAGGEMLQAVDVSTDELVGKTIWERYPEELATQFEPNFRAALDGETNSFEIEYHDRDWLTYTLPVRDDEGDIFAGMVMVQDITERREYERKLEESNERLEQFAYAASHDLQEPLRMVSSYLQLIERRYGDELDDDGREFIEFAVDGAERMRDMIEGLLEYSRIETQGNQFEPVDLDTVLSDVRADLQFQIDESDTEITAESLPSVKGDITQLRQVFQNLLDNAIEYSGDDPPSVHVATERDGSDWRISVSDEGIGIDPDEADRIFEVFQRLHSHDEHTGTGIGLALCRRIIERHGGDIWVESKLGEGATFSFTLPVEEETDE